MSNKAEIKCALCKKPVNGEHSPFCSKACKDKDLLQWLGDGYRMPGPAAEYEDSPGAFDFE